MATTTSNSQTTRISFALIATFLAMGMTFSCSAAGTHQKRKEVIGHVDPRGYRCRFTLSTDWQSADDRDLRHGPVDGRIDEFTLFPKGRTRGATDEPPQIYLQTCGKALMPGDVSLVHGYPEPNGWGKARLITHLHLRIDGCPATMVRTLLVDGGKRYRETEFYVYVPNRSILYLLHTNPDSAAYDRMDREMQAIIRTFHVERIQVAVRFTGSRDKWGAEKRISDAWLLCSTTELSPKDSRSNYRFVISSILISFEAKKWCVNYCAAP